MPYLFEGTSDAERSQMTTSSLTALGKSSCLLRTHRFAIYSSASKNLGIEYSPTTQCLQ